MRPHLLFRAKEKFPKNVAIVDQKEIIHYATYFSSCYQIKHYLQNYHCLTEGTKIALQLENSSIYALFIMSLQILGAVAIHVSPLFPTHLAKVLLNKICDADTTPLIITDREQSYTDQLTGFKVLKPKEILDRCIHPSQSFTTKTADITNLVNAACVSNKQWVDMTLTSASGGNPKPVIHTYGNHYYSALGSNMNLKLKPNDLWLICLPLFHVGGQAILYRAALSGAGVIFARTDEFKTIYTQHNVTHISLVPTQLYRMIQNLEICDQLSKLKVILIGGAHLPVSLLNTAINKKLNIYTSYGSSEMSSQIVTHSNIIQNTSIHSVGKSIPFRKLKITDEKEITVKGPCLFAGYYQQKKVRLPLGENNYFHTGDLGEFDAHGCLTILGRKDNMFISGGENIYPEEIERKLEEIEGIHTALVVSIFDAEFGARPVGFIDLSSNKPWNQTLFKDINKQLEQVLPRFKIPIHYLRLPSEKDLKHNRKKLENYAKKQIMGPFKNGVTTSI